MKLLQEQEGASRWLRHAGHGKSGTCRRLAPKESRSATAIAGRRPAARPASSFRSRYRRSITQSVTPSNLSSITCPPTKKKSNSGASAPILQTIREDLSSPRKARSGRGIAYVFDDLATRRQSSRSPLRKLFFAPNKRPLTAAVDHLDCRLLFRCNNAVLCCRRCERDNTKIQEMSPVWCREMSRV